MRAKFCTDLKSNVFEKLLRGTEVSIYMFRALNLSHLIVHTSQETA